MGRRTVGTAKEAGEHRAKAVARGRGAGLRHQAGGRLLIGSAGIVRLSPGHGHAMLESPTANLVPGQTVTLVLTFAGAGELTVQAPVIALGADPPGGRQ